MHNFIQRTQLQVQPTVCKGRQFNHVHKVVVALVPSFSTDFECKLLSVLKQFTVFTQMWIPHRRCILKMRSDDRDVQLSGSSLISMLIESTIQYTQYFLSLCAGILNMLGPGQIQREHLSQVFKCRDRLQSQAVKGDRGMGANIPIRLREMSMNLHLDGFRVMQLRSTHAVLDTVDIVLQHNIVRTGGYGTVQENVIGIQNNLGACREGQVGDTIDVDQEQQGTQDRNLGDS